ncbi:MAG: exopolysaccharide biosynthesis polyprenyl glycosylphosphotransferase [Clostridia bacterium]|nr:exopolysaccharide biosynthesis polyprenyl glycosylphosphotransferase [Clostridia bacterium]
MKEYAKFANGAERIIDIFINICLVYLGYYVTYCPPEVAANVNPIGQFTTAGLLCFCSFLIYDIHNLYRPMRNIRVSYFIRRIVFSNFTILLICVFLAATVTDYFVYYASWAMITCIFSIVVMSVKKTVMIFVLHAIRLRQKSLKKVLLITDSQEMTEEYLWEIHSNPEFGYEVIGYVGNLAIEGVKHLGATGDLDRILQEMRPDEVVIAFETVRKSVITKYITICDDHCLKVFVVPAICGFFKSPRQMTSLGTLPMVDVRCNPLDNPTNQFIKRVTDIVLASFFIILFSPIMVVTAIGVRLSSPGPILFRQKRVGMHNKEFTIYKFRSMRVNAKESVGWTTDYDPRKTAFGNFIRKFSIDELPQFFNVLKGDMSIVGPRPEIPYYVEQFRKTVPLYMLKHSVRPGITGLAQIRGLRGDTSIQLRIDEDINYIEHWSWFRDWKILILTPFKFINFHEKRRKKSADKLGDKNKYVVQSFAEAAPAQIEMTVDSKKKEKKTSKTKKGTSPATTEKKAKKGKKTKKAKGDIVQAPAQSANNSATQENASAAQSPKNEDEPS